MAVDDIKEGYQSLYRTVIYRYGDIVKGASRVYDSPKAARYYGTQATVYPNSILEFKVFRVEVEAYSQREIPKSKAETMRALAASAE